MENLRLLMAGFSLISGAGGDILIEMYVALINRTKAGR